MLHSMTGYGKGSAEGTLLAVTVEIRSLNSRFLDINIKVPHGGWPMEPFIRKTIQGRLSRGRVDVNVRWELKDPQKKLPMEVFLRRARAYKEALEKLGSELGIPGVVDLSLIASYKELLKEPEYSLEGEEKTLEEALGAALDALEEMRAREGHALGKDLQDRASWLQARLVELNSTASSARQSQLDKFRRKIKEMLSRIPLEPYRLEQEVALYAERLDVTEELLRLESHILQFNRFLEEGGPVGRKLDFVLQEMHREINTLATKAMDAKVSHMAVEVKAQIERMKEQVQNIE